MSVMNAGLPSAGSSRNKPTRRGAVTILGGNTTVIATIPTVNPAKAKLRWLGNLFSNVNESATIVLTDSNTITATRASSGATLTIISYELDEEF